MGAKTDIEWADSTWNPVSGCSFASDGCLNCYARGIAKRFKGTKAFPHGFDVVEHPERLCIPSQWRRPRKVFVCSMGDLFHRLVGGEFVKRVFDEMEKASHHTYFVLTKRPDNMLNFLESYSSWDGTGKTMRNVWFGVSVENNEAIDRIRYLTGTPGINRFVSFEPLLEVLDVDLLEDTEDFYLDWIICGAETGSKARPMPIETAHSLRSYARRTGIPFFFKKWSRGLDGGDMPRQFPDFDRHRKGREE